MSVSSDDIEDTVERSYWFRPGQTLEIEIDGLGTTVVTGRILDHVPSMVISGGEQLDPEPGELRVISPTLLRKGRLVFQLEGLISVSDKNRGVVMYIPAVGRYLLSLSPLQGAVEGQIRQSRVQFEINGEPYEFLMAAPVAGAEHVWILHEPNYRPSQETTDGLDDEPFIGMVDVTTFLTKTSTKN